MSSVEVCQDRLWRDLPISNPVSSGEFVPEASSYYTSSVLPAVWPACIVLGLAAVFLLGFLIWRSTRRCVLLWQKNVDQNSNRLELLLKTERLRLWGYAAAIVAAAFTVGCILSAVWAAPHLVPGAFDVIQQTRDYAAEVLDTADGAIARAQSLDGSLAQIQLLLAQEINSTMLDAELECLRPWLDSLPDLEAVANQIDGAQQLIHGTVSPALSGLQSNVSSLAAGIGTTASPGAVSTAISAAAGSRTSVLALIAQAQAMISATNALPTDVNDANSLAALQNLESAVQDLLTSPAGSAADYDAKVAMLRALQQDLQTLDSALGTLYEVNSTLSNLKPAATTLLNDTLPDLLSTLQSVQSGYTQAAPCVSRLIQAAQNINATIVQLPAELNSNVQLLENLKLLLDELFLPKENSTDAQNTSSSWMHELETLSQSFNVDTMLGPAESTVDSVLTSLGTMGNLTDTATSVGNIASTMETAKPVIQTLRGLLLTAIALHPQATAYGLVRTTASTIAGQLADEVGNLSSTASAMFDAADAAEVTVSQLAADPVSLTSLIAEPDGSIPSAQAQLAQIPAPSSYAEAESELLARYAELPKPLGNIVDQSKDEIASILSGVDEALVSARSRISSAVTEVQQPLADARKDVLGKIDEEVDKYEPTVKHWDDVRLIVMYVLLSVLAALGIAVGASILIRWPAGVKIGVALVAIILIAASALFVALTLAIKIGNDGCANLEAQIVLRIGDNTDAAIVAQYWLYDQGNIEQIAETVFNFDVNSIQADINNGRQEVLSAVEGMVLSGNLSTLVNESIASTYTLQAEMSSIQDQMNYTSVHPVYMHVKEYACCSGLNAVAWLWLGLVLTAAAGLLLCTLCLPVIHSMDLIPINSWWGRIGRDEVSKLAAPAVGFRASSSHVGWGSSIVPGLAPREPPIARRKSKENSHQDPSWTPTYHQRSDTIPAWSSHPTPEALPAGPHETHISVCIPRDEVSELSNTPLGSWARIGSGIDRPAPAESQQQATETNNNTAADAPPAHQQTNNDQHRDMNPFAW